MPKKPVKELSVSDEFARKNIEMDIKLTKAANKLKKRIKEGDTLLHKGLRELGAREESLKQLSSTLLMIDDIINEFIGYQSRDPWQLDLYDEMKRDITNPNHELKISTDEAGNTVISVYAKQETPVVSIKRIPHPKNKGKKAIFDTYEVSKYDYKREISKDLACGLYLTMAKELVSRIQKMESNEKGKDAVIQKTVLNKSNPRS